MRRTRITTASIICIAAFFAAAASASAQPLSERTDKLEYFTQVHFRWDDTKLYLDYLGNRQALKEFAYALDTIGIERIDSIVIASQSSPEGIYEHNLSLSQGRAASMKRYMLKNHPEIKHLLHVNPEGESWEQLRRYVVRDTVLTDDEKNKIISTIDLPVSGENGINIGTKKWRMSRVPQYKYLYKTYYPVIRNSTVCIIYYKVEEPVTPRMEEVAEVEQLPAVDAQFVPEVDIPMHFLDLQKRKTLFALKTNLLYDAVTALNFEVEVPIGEKFSVMVEDVFPWWETGNKYCLEMWEMGAEARWWFARNYKRDALTGHFAALYGMTSRFDFQSDLDLCHQGEYWSAGITYGYATPISKHLNMEFSLSLGYLNSSYRHYQPTDVYDKLIRDPYKLGRVEYWGPTKVKISLVLPICSKRSYSIPKVTADYHRLPGIREEVK